MSDLSKQPPDYQQEDDDLAAAILGYLEEHPQATDNLEGIAEWWLTRRRVRVDLKRLVEVLRQLTDKGLLEEIVVGTSRLYRLRRRDDANSQRE